MEALGHSGYSLSRKLMTSEAVISNIRLGKNPPNIQLVRDLLKEYEEVDPAWLLTGKGRMFSQPAAQGANASSSEALPQRMDERFDELLKLLKHSIATQVERNVLVDEAISGLEKKFETLRPSSLKKGHRKEV